MRVVMDEKRWLEEFARTRSDEAFARLVEANVDLVYSAARRQLGDSPDAQDATQAVFIILAKKARSLPRDVVLAGWLLRTTRYVCRNAIRQRARRRIHEQKAAEMRSEIQSVPAGCAFETISPALDEAMLSLASKDRDAVVLRYFQNCELAEVASALKTTPEAARKRVNRAVQRLADFFRERGTSIPAASLEAALIAGAVQAAPAGLTQTISSTAGSLAAASGAAGGASVALAKGALFMMNLKTNALVAASVAVLFFGGAAVFVASAKTPLPYGGAERTALAASPADVSKADALAQEGWALWGQQKFAQAETRFSAAVKLNPKLTNAWNGLGWSQMNQGNTAKARVAFERVVALEPGHAGAENGLGWISFNAGKVDESQKHFLSAANNGATAAYAGLARTYLLQSDWAKAKVWAGKLVDGGDESAKPLLEAAVAERLSDELRQEIDPPTETGAGDLQRGWQLLNKGQAAQAISLFRAAIQKNPKDANLQNGLGWALMRAGKNAEAKKAFEESIRLDPKAFGAMNGLAQILNREGKTEEAVELWKKLDAIAAQSNTTNAGTYSLAQLYLDQKKYAEAAPLFARLAKEMPDDPKVKKGLEESQSKAGL